MPQIEFSKAISDQIRWFSTILASLIFRTFRVFGVHEFLQMWGLYGLPCKPTDAPWKVSMEEHSFSPRSWIWDQNPPKNNFQVGPKDIFELVRPKVVSDIFTSHQSFCRIEFSDHSRCRSSSFKFKCFASCRRPLDVRIFGFNQVSLWQPYVWRFFWTPKKRMI